MERPFLSIREAADVLGVDYKTVYRLVREGELPAGKIGGVYRIRREDLEALFERHRPRPLENSVLSGAWITCGRCRCIISRADEVGGTCVYDGCTAVLCRTCWLSEPEHYCEAHIPSPAERIAAARAALEAGRIPLLVTAAEARRRELAFLARFEDKVRALKSIPDPLSGRTIRIHARQIQRTAEDASVLLADLLHVGYLEAEMRSQLPLNAALRFTLGKPPAPLLEARVLSNLAAHARDGFDTQPLTLETVLAQLQEAVTRAEASGRATVLGLAATTGWAAAAAEYVSDAPRSNTFYHRLVLPCLIDLVDNRLICNRLDARIRPFLDLFTPLLPDEEVVRVASYIEETLLVRESLSLDEVMQATATSKEHARRAFEQLTATRRFIVYRMPGEGEVISRVEG